MCYGETVMNQTVICMSWVAFNLGLTKFTYEHRYQKFAINETRNKRVKSEHGNHGWRSATAGITYRESTINSFGWWPMAKFLKNKAGEQAVLFRNATYSSKTSGQQGAVRGALCKMAPGVPVFLTHCDPATASHAEVCQDYIARSLEHFNKALAARKYAGSHVQWAGANLKAMEEYCAFFNYKCPAWMNPLENDPARLLVLETKLAKLSILQGVPINAFWRKKNEP